MTDAGTLTVIQGDIHVRARDAREPGHFWADNELIGFLPQIGPMGFTLYMLLAYHAKNNTGRSWPSVATLAKEMGVSEPSVLKYTEILETAKLIIVTRPQSVSKNGNVVRHNCTYTLVNLKHEAKKQAESGKNSLPGVVNVIDQGGKADLPGVVNDVYLNNTKNNKTKRTKQNTSLPQSPEGSAADVKSEPIAKPVEQSATPPQPIPDTVTIFKNALELPKESSAKEKVSSSPDGNYVPPAGYERLYVSRQVDLESRAFTEHLIAAGNASLEPKCKRCGIVISEGTKSPLPAPNVVYSRCLGKEPKQARASPKEPAEHDPLFDWCARYVIDNDPVVVYVDKDLSGWCWKLVSKIVTAEKRLTGAKSLNKEARKTAAAKMADFLTWYDRDCEGCTIPGDVKKFGKHINRWYESRANETTTSTRDNRRDEGLLAEGERDPREVEYERQNARIAAKVRQM